VGRVPRRYRGKDFVWWLVNIGIADETVDDLDSPAERFDPNPHVTGKDGGHTLNLHRFAREGVTLLGHLEAARGSKVRLADDLHENLEAADKFAAELKKGIDKFVEKSGMEAPEEDKAEMRAGYEIEAISELDLEEAGISAIVWATGYTFDFGWVKFPIFDEFGYPIQKRGVTPVPGLYFLGLHWLHTIESGLFAGIAGDAAHVVDHIAER
jgi:putative flavoprotein involved in K+ transport